MKALTNTMIPDSKPADTSCAGCTSEYWPEVRDFLYDGGPKAKENYKPSCQICYANIRLNHKHPDDTDDNSDDSEDSEDPDADECVGMVVLPCGHMFGANCLDTWLLRFGEQLRRCPTCRIPL